MEGIDLTRYEALSGRSLSNRRIAALQAEDLVAPIGNHALRATPAGMIVLDAVVADSGALELLAFERPDELVLPP